MTFRHSYWVCKYIYYLAINILFQILSTGRALMQASVTYLFAILKTFLWNMTWSFIIAVDLRRSFINNRYVLSEKIEGKGGGKQERRKNQNGRSLRELSFNERKNRPCYMLSENGIRCAENKRSWKERVMWLFKVVLFGNFCRSLTKHIQTTKFRFILSGHFKWHCNEVNQVRKWYVC